MHWRTVPNCTEPARLPRRRVGPLVSWVVHPLERLVAADENVRVAIERVGKPAGTCGTAATSAHAYGAAAAELCGVRSECAGGTERPAEPSKRMMNGRVTGL
eukprot:5841046-Prymnesium_polylepis.1